MQYDILHVILVCLKLSGYRDFLYCHECCEVRLSLRLGNHFSFTNVIIKVTEQGFAVFTLCPILPMEHTTEGMERIAEFLRLADAHSDRSVFVLNRETGEICSRVTVDCEEDVPPTNSTIHTAITESVRYLHQYAPGIISIYYQHTKPDAAFALCENDTFDCFATYTSGNACDPEVEEMFSALERTWNQDGTTPVESSVIDSLLVKIQQKFNI